MSNEEILKVLDGLIQFADEILPQAGPLCFDVGNLNDSLILGRKLQRELNHSLSKERFCGDKIDVALDLLSLVEDEFPAIVSEELLQMLTPETLSEVTSWAAAVYAQASDNDVEIPEMPNVLKG